MTSVYILKTDRPINDQRPTTDHSWNGHILATDHPIHFTFGSRLWFSGSVDRMTLHQIGANPRSRPSQSKTFLVFTLFH